MVPNGDSCRRLTVGLQIQNGWYLSKGMVKDMVGKADQIVCGGPFRTLVIDSNENSMPGKGNCIGGIFTF